MSILKPATRNLAFAKIGIYGGAGSGKTYTAAKIAVGLWRKYKLKKPVAMFDTEPGAQFIIPQFEQAKIPFLTVNSRSLEDAFEFVTEVEKECSIGIFDSVTHIWRNTVQSYLDQQNETNRRYGKKEIFSLEMHHWGPIKKAWQDFSDRYISSKAHLIVCGRAGTMYRYQKNDQGRTEIIDDGTRMATEKEFGYEPSLLIEMQRVSDGHGSYTNTAFVEKDRADLINSKIIEKPSFEDFLPHFEALNFGGDHIDKMDSNSKDLFRGKVDGTGWTREAKERDAWLGELKGLFVTYKLDGTSKDAKEKRISILEKHFGTRSWPRVEQMRSEEIRNGYESIFKELDPKAASESATVSANNPGEVPDDQIPF